MPFPYSLDLHHRGLSHRGRIDMKARVAVRPLKALALLTLPTSLLLGYGLFRGEPVVYGAMAALLIVALFPMFRDTLLGRLTDIGEPIFFVLVLYVVHFVVRALYLDHYPSEAYGAYWGTPPAYSSGTAAQALWYVVAGVTSMIVAYHSKFAIRVARRIPRPGWLFNSSLPGWPALGLVGLGLIGQVILFQMGYGTAATGRITFPAYLNLVQSFASLLPIGVGLYWVSAVSSHRRTAVVGGIALFVIYVSFVLAQGWRGALLGLLWMVVLPIHYLRHRLSVRTLGILLAVAMMVTVAILIPLMSTYRVELSRSNYSVEGAMRATLAGWSTELPESLRFLFNRMVGLDSIMILVENGERLFGRTLVYTVLGFIPRILWPAKPDLNLGRLFAVELWAQPVDIQNSMAVMNIGDLLWNFDLLGVFVGMALLGIVYRITYEYLLRSRTPASVLVYVLLFPRLINIESGISMLVLGLVSSGLTLAVALVAVRLMGSLTAGAGARTNPNPGRASLGAGKVVAH